MVAFAGGDDLWWGMESKSLGPSDVAWQELAAGRWQAARAAFADLLRGEETGAHLEGLSWAAWWLDDVDAVFDARERAFRFYERAGQQTSAARVATWLAADHLDFRGASAVAAGWLQRAHRLLADLEPTPDHGWLAFHEGYLALQQNETADAATHGAAAAAAGRTFRLPDLEMLGLALEGAALVAQADLKTGMARLDEAVAIALHSDVEIPISRAWTCCFMVAACESVRDYERAFEWCDHIADFAARYDSAYMLGFCMVHHGAIDTARGRWQQAEAEFDAASVAYARSRPLMMPQVVQQLAELRRRQGRLDEAESLLDALGADAALAARAAVALDRGNAAHALELAERALRRMPDERRLERVAALELIVQAGVQCADLAGAARAADELEQTARIAATWPLRAAADRARALLLFACGDVQRARTLLEDVVDGFERMRARPDAAQARVLLSATLLALGRPEAAEREARLARETLEQMGALPAAWRLPLGLATDAGAAASSQKLTPRELEVLHHVAAGSTNRQIATRLYVSEHTIHRHVTSILRKLGTPSRTAAAAHALKTGMIRPASQ